MHIGLHHHRQQGPVDAAAGFQQRREEGALPQLGDAQFHIAGLGRQQPGAGPVAVGGALLGALIGPGADVLGRLGVDQRLQHQSKTLADEVEVTAGAQCIKQLGQGRLAEGHRGESPWCEPWSDHTELHAMAPRLATQAMGLPSKSTTSWDAYGQPFGVTSAGTAFGGLPWE